jgi:Domain of unknown function (DUF6429)
VETDEDKPDRTAPALLRLTLHGGSRAWKSHDPDVLDRLREKALIDEGFIDRPASKSNSVWLTEKDPRESERLFREMFAKPAGAQDSAGSPHASHPPSGTPPPQG